MLFYLHDEDITLEIANKNGWKENNLLCYGMSTLRAIKHFQILSLLSVYLLNATLLTVNIFDWFYDDFVLISFENWQSFWINLSTFFEKKSHFFMIELLQLLIIVTDKSSERNHAREFSSSNSPDSVDLCKMFMSMESDYCV